MSNDTIYQYVNGELAALSGGELLEYYASKEQWEDGANARSCAEIRQKRNALLRDSDITLLRALEAGTDFSNLRTYRQALRDIPAQPAFPADVIWPDLDLL
jgi:hypothetical protein